MGAKMCIVLLLITIFGLIQTQEVFLNSAKTCEICVCDSNEQVFNLNCNDKGMQHVLAEWPTQNQTLIATFSNNNIGTLETLARSSAVVELVYSHCSIKYIDPAVFKNIPKIKFVDLSYNLLTSETLSADQFKGAYNDSVWEPLELTTLNLAYNQIHTLAKNLFIHMMDLQELNLEGNHFRVLDIPTQAALDSLTKLERLNLANNDLTELTGNTIMNLTNLVELDLSYNRIDFVPVVLGEISMSLEKLKLDGNPIFEITDETFISIQNLVELSLNHMFLLDRVLPNSFTSLHRLRKLELSHNPLLTILDSETFPDHPDLIEVYMNNNSLTNIEQGLLKWSQLKVFEFKDNPLICSCDLFQIQKSLDPKITQEQDGPRCMDNRIFKSRPVFFLTSDICNAHYEHHRITHIDQRFSVMRVAIITLATILTITTLMVGAVALLKYRRKWRDQNYPFVSEVRYNPVNVHAGMS